MVTIALFVLLLIFSPAGAYWRHGKHNYVERGHADPEHY